jgi:alkylated DNA repair protein alkB family protein 1
MEDPQDCNSVSAFKRSQVYHRRQGDNPNRSDDLEEVVDFSWGQDDRITTLSLPKGSSDITNIYRGPIYGLAGFPGLLYAPQALTESLQFELAYHSVSEFCERPHRTNIDLCLPKKTEERNDEEHMWELWKEENMLRGSAKKQKPDPAAKKKYRSFKKLSWATMGYHYDWTERSYDKGFKSDMPSLVGDISKIFARTSLLLESPYKPLTFTPSASIVNYYNIKSNMGGHRDDLELAMDKPIVSISMGLSAIFLLGGETKDDAPVVPILIRKGDVLCMGGDSRLNFHAMARVLPSSVSTRKVEQHNLFESIDRQVSLNSLSFPPSDVQTGNREALEEYLSQHRINMNIRQVYPDTEENA